MKKRNIRGIIAAVAAVSILLMLAGCACGRKNGQVSFSAIVVEVNGTQLIVCPDEGSAELRSADRISVSIKTVSEGEPEFAVGDRVSITYSGEIMETYPAQLGGVTEVAHIG